MSNDSHRFESLLNGRVSGNLPKWALAGLLIIQWSMHMLCNMQITQNIVGTLLTWYFIGCHNRPNLLTTIPSTGSIVILSLLSSWLKACIFQYSSTGLSTVHALSCAMQSSQYCRFCQSFCFAVFSWCWLYGIKICPFHSMDNGEYALSATMCIQWGSCWFLNKRNKRVSQKQLK